MKKLIAEIERLYMLYQVRQIERELKKLEKKFLEYQKTGEI